jgi:hypothetical protein
VSHPATGPTASPLRRHGQPEGLPDISRGASQRRPRNTVPVRLPPLHPPWRAARRRPSPREMSGGERLTWILEGFGRDPPKKCKLESIHLLLCYILIKSYQFSGLDPILRFLAVEIRSYRGQARKTEFKGRIDPSSGSPDVIAEKGSYYSLNAHRPSRLASNPIGPMPAAMVCLSTAQIWAEFQNLTF